MITRLQGKIDAGDRKLLKSALAKYLLPPKCVCMLCGAKFHHYHIQGNASEAEKIHEMAIMGPRRVVCPYCRSSDKNRWLWWVIENKTEVLAGNRRLLHFAPEGILEKRLRAVNNQYTTCDIVPGKGDEVVDMTKIQYSDNTFDYIIASMVLEHIPDEKAAIQEVLRVLKPNGKALLTVPVALDLERTLEDDSITSEKDRLRVFGQEDHVRLYGTDIVERWRQHGAACVDAVRPDMYFNEKQIMSMGIHPKYTVWMLSK